MDPWPISERLKKKKKVKFDPVGLTNAERSLKNA